MNTFAEIYSRIKSVTGCRTQVELANYLNIRQASISDAKKRDSIPDGWIVVLVDRAQVNPHWIRTGRGSQYLVPADAPQPDMLARLAGRELDELVNAVCMAAAEQITRQVREMVGEGAV